MPARKDYPFKELYWQVKPLISKGKYAFVRKKASVLRLYVYADHKNAMQRFRDYLIDHQEEYEALENHEKDWYTVKFDYFVLISNIDNSGGTAHSVFLQD